VINFITPADDPDVPPPQPSVNSISAWVPVNTLTVSMINSQMLLMSDFTKEYDDNAMVMYPLRALCIPLSVLRLIRALTFVSCADLSITWQASAENCQKLTVKYGYI